MIGLLSLTGVYLAAFLYAGIVESAWMGNILSPVGALIAAMMMLVLWLKTNVRYVKAMAVCHGLAFLSYAAADIVWASLELGLGVDPSEDMLIMALYALPNVLIFVSVVIFTANHFRSWNHARLMLDAVMFTIVSMLIIWILFFDRSFSLFSIIFQEGSLSAVPILSNMLVFVMIAIWYLSVKSGRLELHLYLLLPGIMLYCLTDLYYYYTVYKDIYVPNSVIDVVYVASFLLIALGRSEELV